MIFVLQYDCIRSSKAPMQSNTGASNIDSSNIDSSNIDWWKPHGCGFIKFSKKLIVIQKFRTMHHHWSSWSSDFSSAQMGLCVIGWGNISLEVPIHFDQQYIHTSPCQGSMQFFVCIYEQYAMCHKSVLNIVFFFHLQHINI